MFHRWNLGGRYLQTKHDIIGRCRRKSLRLSTPGGAPARMDSMAMQQEPIDWRYLPYRYIYIWWAWYIPMNGVYKWWMKQIEQKQNHRSNPSNSIFVDWIQMARGQSPGTCMFLPYNLVNKFWPIPILLSLETILFGFVWKSATPFHPLLGVFHYIKLPFMSISFYIPLTGTPKHQDWYIIVYCRLST